MSAHQNSQLVLEKLTEEHFEVLGHPEELKGEG